MSPDRKRLHDLLVNDARSASSVARELGIGRRDIEEELRHVIRSAAASGDRVEVIPAHCKDCGFVFATDRLTKPGRCPECRGSRIVEALMRIVDGG